MAEENNSIKAHKLTSGLLLARNTVWNVFGQVVPYLVAIVSIPVLVRSLGTERFGILTLVWLIIGYFNIFNLGLGRAMTQLVSEKLSRDEEAPELAWTGLFLMFLLGLFGMVLLLLLASWITHSVLNISVDLQQDTVNTFRLLAISIPAIVCTDGLNGILAASQRFDLINTVRISMGTFVYAGPLLVLPFSRSLMPIAAVLVASRILTSGINLILCLRVMPVMRRVVRIERTMLKPLIKFGGWMTISNVINPFMVTMDRFFIGALISATAVAYYATPYEVVTKLWIIPISIVGVLFPAFSVSYVKDPQRTSLLFNRGVKYSLMILFPIALLIVSLSHEGLQLWLGSEFAENSTKVLQWLAIGVFINCLALVPFALIQGAGRPDITAKLNMIELPLYLPIVLWAIKAHGIVGAAFVWFARVLIDALVLFFLARRFLSLGVSQRRRYETMIVVALLLLLVAILPTGVVLKAVFLGSVLICFTIASWLNLDTQERGFLKSRLKLGRGMTKHDGGKRFKR